MGKLTKMALLYLGRKGAGPMYSFDMAVALSKYVELYVILSEGVENRFLWDEVALSNSNIRIKYIKTYASKIQFLFRSLNFIKFYKLIKEFNSLNFDLLYSPMGHYWNFIFYKYIKAKRKIQTIHDVNLHVGEDGILNRLLHRFTSYNSDEYIILSDIFISKLVAQGILEHNIKVVPHAMFTKYNSTDNTFIDQYNNSALFFGRIIKYKGLELLLNSLEAVLKKNANFKLLVVGNGDISGCINLFDRYKDNLQLHLEWIPDSDVHLYFKKIDFVILPYIEASQSGVIPLSYSFDKPVIVTNVGGLPNQVVQEKTGLIVQPNEQELADAIIRLSLDRELLYSMKEYIELCIKPCLTWDASAKKILE